jgi:hypothetical protein
MVDLTGENVEPIERVGWNSYYAIEQTYPERTIGGLCDGGRRNSADFRSELQLLEMPSVKAYDSLSGYHPQEAIPSLNDIVNNVVREAVFHGEDFAQVVAGGLRRIQRRTGAGKEVAEGEPENDTGNSVP